jgi:F-type H+-transporting ATPase subunit b
VISIDYTLVIQMINFLVLIVILNRFLFKPILNVLDERKRKIQESEGSVKELEDRIAQQWEAYQRQLQGAKVSATVEKERLKGEGLEAERSLLDQVRTDMARSMEEARRRVQEEADKARASLRVQADDIAREIAQKILGRSLQ